MRRVLIFATLAVAVAVGALATPRAAKADVFIGLPGFGLYIGDDHYRHGPRHYGPRRYGPPPRHYRRHYGPPPRYYRDRRWRHRAWRDGPRWRRAKRRWRRNHW